MRRRETGWKAHRVAGDLGRNRGSCTTRLPSRTWVAWRPGLDTWIAVGSVLAMWSVFGIEHALARSAPLVGQSIQVFVGIILVGTALPVLVVWHLMRRDLDALGLEMHRTGLAMLIGSVVALGSLPAFWNAAAGAGIDPVSQTWAQVLSIWEPLFVFGWLQLRFRDAWGELAAPVLAGGAYALYHLGTEPLPDTLFRLVFGVILGIAFATTRNLLTLLPCAWAFATAPISIAHGQAYGTDTIALRAVVLAIQIGIVAMAYWNHPGDSHADPARQTHLHPETRG